MELDAEQVKTDNDFLLAVNGHRVVSILPMVITTREQAYRTAAWIKIMGESLSHESFTSTYDEVEHAIMNT